MVSKSSLQILLAVWVLWHAVFGVLATFLPDTGAQLSGWSPDEGWTVNMLALSTQYGMVMLLLALVYAIAAIDPFRYIGVLWVAIAEQALGIAYAVYIYLAIGNVTVSQVSIQSVINVAFLAIFALFLGRFRGEQAALSA